LRVSNVLLAAYIGKSLPWPLNDRPWLDIPSRNLAFGARIKLLGSSLLDLVLASPLVALRYRLLIPVREQLVGAIDIFVLALLQGLDGVGIAQSRGR
jgi:hypothetical protein